MNKINTNTLLSMHYKMLLILNQCDVTITIGALCITSMNNFLP